MPQNIPSAQSHKPDSEPDHKNAKRPDDSSSGNTQIMIQLIVMATWVMFIMLAVPRNTQQESIPYSEFVQQVESGLVATAKVSSQKIEYTLKPVPNLPSTEEDSVPTVLTTTPLPTDTALPDILRSQNVEVTAIATDDDGWFGSFFGLLLPFFFIFLLWNMASGRMRGGPLCWVWAKVKLEFMLKVAIRLRLMM